MRAAHHKEEEMVHRVLEEAHVQRLWQLQAFRGDPLITEDGRRVEVEFPGLPGRPGPDFRSARLRIGGRAVVGDVEVHRTPSGWAAHGHEADGAYAGVVLHVVLDRDGGAAPGGIPVLVLRAHLGASAVDVAAGRFAAAPPGLRWPDDPGELGALLEAAGLARWERRRDRRARESARWGAREAAHRAFFRALGFGGNRAAFQEAARLAPAAALEGLGRAEILGRLRRVAGRVGLWRRVAVRPANSPARRMRSAAAILERGPVAETMKGLASVGRLMEWGGLGRARSELIAFHAFLPAEDAVEILRSHRPLASNRKERQIRDLLPHPGAVTNVLRQLGLLELADGLAESRSPPVPKS